MKLKHYTRLWIVLVAALAWESYALNFNTFVSFFALLKENSTVFQDLRLSPEPGKTISLWYGWIGFSLMVLTNFYVIRKRWAPLQKLGMIRGWLDFHIFCGLAGPTFILFHTNFKVGGLVAISFWSMAVSFFSGVIGRYFFTQVVAQKSELENTLLTHELALKNFGELREKTLIFAGAVTPLHAGGRAGVAQALVNSVLGDFRLLFRMPREIRALPLAVQGHLRQYVITKRRIAYLDQFQSIMGYWHSFHLPFAVFMYVVAVIHIATALLFRVSA